jgi:hypothetical protein
MTNYILIFLAGFINSFMDRIHFNEEATIFDKYDIAPQQTFWKQKKFLGIVTLDPWHLAKYLLLGCFIFSRRFYEPAFPNLLPWLACAIDITICMVVWWMGFEFGWRIFKKKK